MKLLTKIIIIILIFVFILTGVASFGLYKSYMVKSKQTPEDTLKVVDNFISLDKIPRQTENEKQFSDYLVKWATDHGFPSIQDRYQNVIINKPAAYGFEDKPLTILQTHMDMSVVTSPGVAFDSNKDSIVIVNDNITLKSDGRTNIGADGGIGIAVAQQIFASDIKCGALRLIVTVKENGGFKGALDIDSKHFNGAYLINLDSEKSSEMIVSSDGTLDLSAEKSITQNVPKKTKALTINFQGESNSIISLCNVLLLIQNSGVEFELASFSGGTAKNEIPATAATQIVVADADITKVTDIVDQTTGACVAASEMPTVVLSDQDKQDALKFVSQIISRLTSMPGMTQDVANGSANLSSLNIDVNGETTTLHLRSSNMTLLNQMDEKVEGLMDECSINITDKNFGPAWPSNPNSLLQGIVQDVYKTQNGTKINVIGVSYGLECAAFAGKNPSLDMVALGSDIAFSDTVDEVINIASIDKFCKLTEGIIIQLQN